MDNHSTCGLSARGLDLPDEGDVFIVQKIGVAKDACHMNDTERTVAEVATSEDRNTSTKYLVEPPGFGTSSREAKGKP